MDSPRSFLGGLSPREFLARHWQKRPLLCRGAIPDFEAPIDHAKLLRLAEDESVESRLVEQRSDGWQLTLGPLTRSRVRRLGKRDWTILVSDLEEHAPSVAPLLEHLDFLPSWRIDDVMASTAVPGGSVGPHFDSYDVFLLQVSGTRRWQISSRFDREALLPDCDLRILSAFEPDEEWVLEPGDLLYLPPHVAHYGVALTPCVTFSLGCRAPSLREIYTHFASELVDATDEHLHYSDPDLGAPDDPTRLDREATVAVGELLERGFHWTEERARRSFAALVTQPKALFSDEFDEPLDAHAADALLAPGISLMRRKGSRWLQLSDTAAGSTLYVNGRAFAHAADTAFARELCASRRFDAVQLEAWKQDEARRALLRDLVAWGYLESTTDAA